MGKAFKIILIIFSLIVLVKREYTYPYLQPHKYLEKATKYHPIDKRNNANIQNIDSKVCCQLS